MKTMTTLKSIALAAVMMIATMASAATTPKTAAGRAPISVVGPQHGYGRPMMRECNCRDCHRARKTLDKHMRKHHFGRQNRMACRTCMELNHMLRHHAEMINAPRYRRF